MHDDLVSLLLDRLIEEQVGLKCRVEVIILLRNLNVVVPEPYVGFELAASLIGSKNLGVL